MKRALTLTLTIALLGSLMFMGFAGTAAASHNDVDQDQDATIDQEANQANLNVQAQFGSADAGTFGTAAVFQNQAQDVDQNNVAIQSGAIYQDQYAR